MESFLVTWWIETDWGNLCLKKETILEHELGVDLVDHYINTNDNMTPDGLLVENFIALERTNS